MRITAEATLDVEVAHELIDLIVQSLRTFHIIEPSFCAVFLHLLDG